MIKQNSPRGLYQLKPTDTERAASLLAEAFLDDPFFMYVLPDVHERRMVSEKFHGRLARHYISIGAAFATSPRLEGLIIINDRYHRHWLKEKLLSLSMIVMMFTLLFRIKASAAVRKALIAGKYEKFVAINMKRFPNRCEVPLLAVDAKHRGQGHMKTLLTAVFDYAQSHHFDVVLETEKEENANRYLHYGMTQVMNMETSVPNLRYYVFVKPA